MNRNWGRTREKGGGKGEEKMRDGEDGKKGREEKEERKDEEKK